MKRVSSHLIFWTFYWGLMTCLEYFWLKTYLVGLSEKSTIIRAFVGAILYMIPHLAFAYYLVYVGLAKMVEKRGWSWVNIGLIVLSYVFSICCIILLARQLVLPHVYGYEVVAGRFFFDPQKFLSIMIEMAFPAGALVAIQFVSSLLAAKEREKVLVQDKLSTELQMLKNQMNPHFLFNTLNNIYALTRKKSDEAPEVVLKLSELLSFMLYESGSNTISIKREIAFLDDYISIQRIRYTDLLNLSFIKEIDDLTQEITPLLILPLVENAFKHGASENQHASFIHLHLKCEKGQLSFSIENSFEESILHKQPNSIGLSNTRRQLELLYGEYKVTVDNTLPTFRVNLFINLNSYGKI